jgi:positive regulator of sigma E activity
VRESGVIISTHAGIARIELYKNEKCSECKACLFTQDHKSYIEVDNSVDAHQGDIVEVEIKPSKFVGYSFLVFIMPIIFMVAGYTITYQLTAAENISIIISFAGLLCSFLLLKGIDKIIGSRNKGCFRIVCLLNAENF